MDSHFCLAEWIGWEEQALLIFERNIFRKICGPKYEKKEWKLGRRDE